MLGKPRQRQTKKKTVYSPIKLLKYDKTFFKGVIGKLLS